MDYVFILLGGGGVQNAAVLRNIITYKHVLRSALALHVPAMNSKVN